MAARWQPLAFVPREVPRWDRLGVVRRGPPPVPGFRLRHWADPGLAARWFRRAYALATDPGALARAEGGGRTPQTDYLASILNSILQGYNALNLVWWTDPVARALYREYVAGPPGPRLSATDFGVAEDYSESWFHGSAPLPEGRNFGGALPAYGQSLFDRFYPRPAVAQSHPLQFVANLLPSVEVGYQPWRFAAAPATEPEGSLLPRRGADQAEDWINAWRSNEQTVAALGECRDERGLRSCGGGWHDARFDAAAAIPLTAEEFNPRVPLRFAAPLRAYLPWLQAWAQACVSRSPEQIITDARAYVIWRNDSEIQSLGGTARFLSEVSSRAPEVAAALSTPSPTAVAIADAIAGLAVGVGTLLSPVTGGISLLIGGAVGAGARIGVQALGPVFSAGVSGRGRDDLGRFKPNFERGWLSGDPTVIGAPDQAAGAPRIEVPDPPPGAWDTGPLVFSVPSLPNVVFREPRLNVTGGTDGGPAGGGGALVLVGAAALAAFALLRTRGSSRRVAAPRRR